MKKKLVKVDEVKIESLIKKNFSREFMKKIYDIYSDDCMSIVEKTILFDKLFTEEFGNRKDYRRIGEGTNRFVCLLDNHIIKVAYNYLAYIDNMNELAQAKYKEKYLAQAYETNGIILVSEYVTVMDKEEFLENQTAISRILGRLEADRNIYEKDKSLFYILGDMGMSNKNYGNWGRRMNGEIVILDYGYLYELSYNEWREVAKCPTCGSSLRYLDDYSELICEKQDCGCKVKYTTLRNRFGYANIIKNIKYNLNNDKYIKFNEDGKIVVDVMEEVVEEEKEIEEFVMTEEMEAKINKAMEKFFEIAEYVKNNTQLSIDDREMIKEEIFNEVDLYDEMLLPCVLASLELTHLNVDKYLKDFDKKSRERYNEIYLEYKREFEINSEKEEDVIDDIPDYIGDEEGYNVKGFESNIRVVDNVNDNVKKVTSLDDILGSTIDDCFSNLFMADENSDKLNNMTNDNELTLESIMKALNEEIESENKAKEVEESDDETDIEDELKECYDRLVDALTNVIESYYVRIGYSTDEDEYVSGDVYRTYLNGDFIDLDYSPRVNAMNILGGWEPDKFAFPLYRHMLLKFDYDMDLVDEDYEHRYRIDENIDMPEDIYSNVENRSIVINQIMSRFEEGVPAKHVFVNTMGKELNDYYEALDDYYESIKESKVDVGFNDPEYYLHINEQNEKTHKLIREAKSELIDELIDQSMRLEDFKDTHKIVYYFDIEAIMTNTEANIYDLVKSSKFRNINGNLKDEILNRYYMEYGTVLADSAFDIFKYDGSTVKEVGCETHPRLIRPTIKAKLVPKDSNVDSYKPEVFNRNKYNRMVIEQRYEILINTDNPEDVTKMNDIKLELNRRGLYYTESKLIRYSLKRSKDNLRYALTEQEVELIDEYDRMLGFTDVKDTDRLFKKAVVEILNRKYELRCETKELLNDLYKYDLSEAFANRLFKINVLELSGTMNRLDFLQQIEG